MRESLQNKGTLPLAHVGYPLSTEIKNYQDSGTKNALIGGPKQSKGNTRNYPKGAPRFVANGKPVQVSRYDPRELPT